MQASRFFGAQEGEYVSSLKDVHRINAWTGKYTTGRNKNSLRKDKQKQKRPARPLQVNRRILFLSRSVHFSLYKKKKKKKECVPEPNHQVFSPRKIREARITSEGIDGRCGLGGGGGGGIE